MPVALLLLVLLPAPPAMAAELGRLFLTPLERQALDEARARGGEVPVGLIDDSMRLLRFDGRVSRTSGPATVWLNGQPDSRPMVDAHLTPAGELEVVDDGVPYRLRPGQIINLDTGVVADAFQPLPASPPPPPPAPTAEP